MPVNRNTEAQKFKLWTSQGLAYEGTGQSVLFHGEASEQTDSLKPDTDGDGVMDGQEVYGYKITVMWYEGKDLKSKDVIVVGCAKAGGAYKAADCSTLLDVDADGIYDRDEINPRNANAAKGVKDFVKAYGSDKAMMDNAFNPYLRETVPPVLVRATAQSSVEWGWTNVGILPVWGVRRAWTVVSVEAVDVVPYTVRVTAGWLGRSASAALPAGRGSMIVEVDIDFWLDYLVEFDVRVDLSDRSGNVMDPAYTTKVKGIFAGVLAFLEWLVSGIAAIAEAVAAAMRFLIDLIIQAFKAGLDALFGPIKKALDSWSSNVLSVVDAIARHNSPSLLESNPAEAARQVASAIMSTELWIIVGICIAITILLTIVMYMIPVLAMVSDLISLVLASAVLAIVALSYNGAEAGKALRYNSDAYEIMDESESPPQWYTVMLAIILATMGLILAGVGGMAGHASGAVAGGAIGLGLLGILIKASTTDPSLSSEQRSLRKTLAAVVVAIGLVLDLATVLFSINRAARVFGGIGAVINGAILLIVLLS